MLLQDNNMAYLFLLEMLLSVHDRQNGFPVSCRNRATKPRLRLVLLWQPKQDPGNRRPSKVMNTLAGPGSGP